MSIDFNYGHLNKDYAAEMRGSYDGSGGLMGLFKYVAYQQRDVPKYKNPPMPYDRAAPEFKFAPGTRYSSRRRTMQRRSGINALTIRNPHLRTKNLDRGLNTLTM